MSFRKFKPWIKLNHNIYHIPKNQWGKVMAVVNAPEPFCQYHLRNWLRQTICHTPWQLKFELQFGEVHWLDSANQRHPKRNAIYYHHCNKKWKSSCVSITESSLTEVILNLWGQGGVGTTAQSQPNCRLTWQVATSFKLLDVCAQKSNAALLSKS